MHLELDLVTRDSCATFQLLYHRMWCDLAGRVHRTLCDAKHHQVPHLHQDAGNREHGPPRMHALRLREPGEALLVGAQAKRVPLQHMITGCN